MVCLCKDVLEAVAVPALTNPPPLPPLSPAARAAQALHDRLIAAEPDVPPPEEALAGEAANQAVRAREIVRRTDLGRISSLIGWVQFQQLAASTHGNDPNDPAAPVALSRMTATLNQRLQELEVAPVGLRPLADLARLNQVTDELQEVFDELDDGDAPEQHDGTRMVPPQTWGGPATQAMTVLERLMKPTPVPLDDAFLTQLRQIAETATHAMQQTPLDTARAAPLMNQISAIRSLRDSLGVDPLRTDTREVRQMVAERFRRMAESAARHGVPLTEGETQSKLRWRTRGCVSG